MGSVRGAPDPFSHIRDFEDLSFFASQRHALSSLDGIRNCAEKLRVKDRC